MKRAKPEPTARGIILDALGIEARRAADMPEELRARVLTNRPSAEEIAISRWMEMD